ncbi:MAG: NUDIX domain-containing protein [Microbacteriaceae bacterium]|nr:NUDIX domain-containing protein [Microbacteriaceae bacterium]MCL2795703.1 NUDIX domain-containing protein [Microbacteriaceae bacterium]
MDVDDLITRLRGLPASDAREAFLGFATERGDAAWQREGGPEHVTASAFVFSPDLAQVLLCFHKKGRFWVQFGGHIDPEDATVAEAAQREAREESGIPDLELASGAITDLDRHDLHGGFSCAAHWDIGFVAFVAPDARIEVSEESEDVRWFPVDAPPAEVPERFERRLAAARGLAASLQKKL